MAMPLGGSEYGSGQGGRKAGGGGGRSQELNHSHSHVSNLRLFLFLPKGMNQIKLVLLCVNQSNYQICDTH